MTDCDRPQASEERRCLIGAPGCPHCGGAGEVSGNIDDVQVILTCSCAGGSGEAVRWLLGLEDQPPGDIL
jgi:hypothetical protein